MFFLSSYFTDIVNPLFAASSLPVFFLQIVLVVVVIYLLASKYAQNPGQRIMNLLLGLIGCSISFLAYVQLDDISRFKWLVQGIYFLIMPPIVMILGGAAGIALSLLIGWSLLLFYRLLLRLIRGSR